jgi:cytochrome c
MFMFRLAFAIVVAMAASPAQASTGDAARGEQLYQQRCTACHSLDANRIGPMHRGVFGRKSGSVVGFNYSPAVRKLNVVWTETTLDKWLKSPTAMAPGTMMGLSVPNAQDRADLIAYLKAVSPPAKLSK